ncbi:MAG: hypothetical protein K6T61_10870 [Bryobacteraceae bacterium]|nr:hypothetical protein [Bryobacteraceae bacterium]
MKRLPLFTALAAVPACLAWQAITVHFNFGGNWTALFCTGAELRQPPELAHERIYLFPNSTGYDGQYYHYQAHDPFLQRGLAAYIDSPRLRYRRMLVPTAAWLLAFGQDRWIDPAFIAVILAFVFLGTLWSARLAVELGRHPAWGFLFLIVPATLISLNRMTVDIALAALAVGFVWHSRRGISAPVLLILALAALARETGVLLAAGYSLYWLAERRLRAAALSAVALLPLVPWYLFVERNTSPAANLGASEAAKLRSPLVWFELREYEWGTLVKFTLHGLDYAILAGVLLALALAVVVVIRGPRKPEAYAGLRYAIAAAAFFCTFGPGDPFALPRVVSPLLVLVTLRGSGPALAPLLLVTPRVLVHSWPELAGVVRALF